MKGKSKYHDDDKNISLFELNQAYENFTANIMYSIIKPGCKKIVFSSAFESEGKSTITSNVAKKLSNLGSKVLLLDIDFRHPTIPKIFSIKNTNGLSDYIISGRKNLSTIVKNIPKYHNLDIITTGSFVPSPASLFSSNSMTNFLNSLDNIYDFVIIDSPPINIISDVLYIAKQTDGVILTVKERSTTHPMLKKAISRFELVDIPILGLVLNFSKQESTSAYNNYYYKNKKDSNYFKWN